MKLEDMIMVVENRKGTETNYLLNLTDYMEAALKLWGEHADCNQIPIFYGSCKPGGIPKHVMQAYLLRLFFRPCGRTCKIL